jgi:hypothetical protein
MLIRAAIALFIVLQMFALCACQTTAKDSQFHKGWSVDSFGTGAY